jgi:hypothetical protein
LATQEALRTFIVYLKIKVMSDLSLVQKFSVYTIHFVKIALRAFTGLIITLEILF